MHEVLQERIAEHRERAEDGDAGDGVGHILVRRISHRVGRNDRGGAADRCAGRDQLRELAIDAQCPAGVNREQDVATGVAAIYQIDLPAGWGGGLSRSLVFGFA